MNLDEHCTDCKEYDHQRHCCPRWNKVIRTTLNDAINAELDSVKEDLSNYHLEQVGEDETPQRTFEMAKALFVKVLDEHRRES